MQNHIRFFFLRKQMRKVTRAKWSHHAVSHFSAGLFLKEGNSSYLVENGLKYCLRNLTHRKIKQVLFEDDDFITAADRKIFDHTWHFTWELNGIYGAKRLPSIIAKTFCLLSILSIDPCSSGCRLIVSKLCCCETFPRDYMMLENVFLLSTAVYQLVLLWIRATRSCVKEHN